MTSILLNDTGSKSPGADAAREVAAIAADLERLKGLITDAGDRLLENFNAFGAVCAELTDADQRQRMSLVVAEAVTALQFQDIAMQLTNHAQRRLGALGNCLVSMPADVSQEYLATIAPAASHPVAQAEMSTGSIDLF